MSKEQKYEIVHVDLDLYITDEDIDDIMCTALEGGITYWCNNATVVEDTYLGEFASEQISRGGSLKLHDLEDGADHVLTKEMLLNGIHLYLKKPVACDCFEMIDHKLRIDTCNVDGAVADAIIQYALFGDVIYG